MSIFRAINSSSIIEEVNITGLYKGKAAKVFEVLGRRTTFVNNTGQHDISDINPALTVFPTLTAGENLELVSTNANDNLGGTGVRSVTITYMNTSNNLATIDANLNGTTPEPMVFFANEIISMEANSVGTNLVAVGNIVLRKVIGAIELEKITAGGNKSLSAKFMIPTGYSGYLIGGSFAGIGQTMDFRLRATVKTFDRTLITPYLFQQNYFLAAGQNSGDLTFAFLKYPALSRIKVSAVAGATGGNPRADTSFTVLIIAD